MHSLSSEDSDDGLGDEARDTSMDDNEESDMDSGSNERKSPEALHDPESPLPFNSQKSSLASFEQDSSMPFNGHKSPTPPNDRDSHTPFNGHKSPASPPNGRKSPATPSSLSGSMSKILSAMNPLLPGSTDSLLQTNSSLMPFFNMTSALSKSKPRPAEPSRRALSSWKTGLALHPPGPGKSVGKIIVV